MLLDDYSKNHMLTWQNGIPEEEICVKIGGDHGRDSFKISFQILNILKPN